MEITWITGGGFIIESSGNRLVIDPYLSDVVEKTRLDEAGYITGATLDINGGIYMR
ncbi:MAG: hypothetical protein ABUK08_07790 [Candidatus Humimicrobiaceae bacterium]